MGKAGDPKSARRQAEQRRGGAFAGRVLMERGVASRVAAAEGEPPAVTSRHAATAVRRTAESVKAAPGGSGTRGATSLATGTPSRDHERAGTSAGQERGRRAGGAGSRGGGGRGGKEDRRKRDGEPAAGKRKPRVRGGGGATAAAMSGYRLAAPSGATGQCARRGREDGRSRYSTIAERGDRPLKTVEIISFDSNNVLN